MKTWIREVVEDVFWNSDVAIALTVVAVVMATAIAGISIPTLASTSGDTFTEMCSAAGGTAIENDSVCVSSDSIIDLGN